MVVQSTSLESIPFSFTLKILGSSPISSTLARQWSFAGAPVFVSVFFLSSCVKVVHFKRKVGFDPSTFRSKVDDLDHRTTVSCLIRDFVPVFVVLLFSLASHCFSVTISILSRWTKLESKANKHPLPILSLSVITSASVTDLLIWWGAVCTSSNKQPQSTSFFISFFLSFFLLRLCLLVLWISNFGSCVIFCLSVCLSSVLH